MKTDTENSLIEEKDLNNHTIPAVSIQDISPDQELTDSDSSTTIQEIKLDTMVNKVIAQRAYIKDISNDIPELNLSYWLPVY